MSKALHRSRSIRFIAGATLAAGIGGCSMPNSSNPTMEVSRALVHSDRASLDLTLKNPSDMDVEVGSVRWTLQYGPLPVADGTWTLGAMVPSKGEYRFSKQVPFTSPALDPSADRVELSGSMDMKTKGDNSDMSLKSAGFVSTQTVQR